MRASTRPANGPWGAAELIKDNRTGGAALAGTRWRILVITHGDSLRVAHRADHGGPGKRLPPATPTEAFIREWRLVERGCRRPLARRLFARVSLPTVGRCKTGRRFLEGLDAAVAGVARRRPSRHGDRCRWPWARGRAVGGLARVHPYEGPSGGSLWSACDGHAPSTDGGQAAPRLGGGNGQSTGDKTPPALALVAAAKQRILGQGGVIVFGKCEESCTLTASGTVPLSNGASSVLKLKPSRAAFLPTPGRSCCSRFLERHVRRYGRHFPDARAWSPA